MPVCGHVCDVLTLPPSPRLLTFVLGLSSGAAAAGCVLPPTSTSANSHIQSRMEPLWSKNSPWRLAVYAGHGCRLQTFLDAANNIDIYICICVCVYVSFQRGKALCLTIEVTASSALSKLYFTSAPCGAAIVLLLVVPKTFKCALFTRVSVSLLSVCFQTKVVGGGASQATGWICCYGLSFEKPRVSSWISFFFFSPPPNVK